MIDLIIGSALNNCFSKDHISDFYQGMSEFEKNDFSIVIFNLSHFKLNSSDISRLTLLLKTKRTKCLFITKQKIDEIEQLENSLFLDPTFSDRYLDEYITELSTGKKISAQINELSTQKRTIPFYLLGGTLLIEPFLKILFLKLSTGFDFHTVFEVVTSIEHSLKIIEFWALFPIAGIALLRPHAMSLFVFTAIQGYSIFAFMNYEKFTWPFVQETPHISSSFLLVLNTALFVYFLIPEHRKPFMTKTKDFFRKENRMSCHFKTKIKMDENLIEVTALNISLNGMMFKTTKKLEEGKLIKANLGNLQITGLIVREIHNIVDKTTSYGVSFSKTTNEEKLYLKEFIDKVTYEENMIRLVS